MCPSIFVLLAACFAMQLTKVSAQDDQIALIIRPAEMEFVWSDRGSGARGNVATYRPQNCFRLGDSAVNNYDNSRRPTGYCVQEVVPGSLAVPIRMNKIWDDTGSGANLDGSFWRFDCPPGFIDLGHASSGSHNPPSVDQYRCINAQLITSSNALRRFIWNDRGSGARNDVSVFGLDCRAPSGTEFDNVIVVYQGHISTSSAGWRCIPRAFYRIDYGSPVVRVDVGHTEYDISRRVPRGQGRPAGGSATVRNCYVNGVQQNPSNKIIVSYEVANSWSWHTTFSIGTTLTVKANLPFNIGGVETSITSTVTNGRGYTTTKSERVTYEADLPIAVPAGFQMIATVTLQLNQYDVPFVAQAAYIRRDGSISNGAISGIYRGFEIADTVFEYGELTACNV